MKKIALLLLGAAVLRAQPAAEVRGSVVDARGGEALSNVVVQFVGGAYRATTDSAGRFRIPGVAAGDYVLNVSTVGYHLLKKSFHLDSGETKDFEVILSPETFHQTDSVEVQASPFEPSRQDSPSTLVLGGNDAKNLASVLADDPLRAVQGLPGVSSNNDFDARFSVRGADFSRIGLYLDGVLLHEPFHMLQGQQVSGSATAFNGDMVEELELHEGAFPGAYEDRTAGVLDVHTRDGNRTGDTFRIAASASNAGVMGEGPLGGRSAAPGWSPRARAICNTSSSALSPIRLSSSARRVFSASSRRSTSSALVPRTTKNCEGSRAPAGGRSRAAPSSSAAGEACSWRRSSLTRTPRCRGRRPATEDRARSTSRVGTEARIAGEAVADPLENAVRRTRRGRSTGTSTPSS